MKLNEIRDNEGRIWTVMRDCSVNEFRKLGRNNVIPAPYTRNEEYKCELVTPILRYQDIERQLKNRGLNADMASDGIVRFVTGLAKKVLIANQCGLLWDEIYSYGGHIPAVMAWTGAAAFTLQIYYDFSGYSDMAIGLGKIFGFTFPENFRYPYESRSITEFWRRWHITLGTWFREYLYIPLGGNRKGAGRQIVNLLVVWFLTGLWHGAGWNFIIWGLYYFAIIKY